MRLSRPGDSYPQSLTKPYVNLLIHTVLVIQSISTNLVANGYANSVVVSQLPQQIYVHVPNYLSIA